MHSRFQSTFGAELSVCVYQATMHLGKQTPNAVLTEQQ